MNKKIYAAKNSILNQKKFYVFLITIMLVGIISGIIFVFFLNNNDKTEVTKEITSFFNLVKTSDGINYSKSLTNSLLVNISYIILIWLLGISIIGFPLILGILFLKSFIFGFSISSIIATYGFKGTLGAFLYVFPHQIIILILYLLLSFYALSFCYKLFSHLFLKKTVNFKTGMNKYLKILAIGIVVSILITFYEVFLSTYFMKLFTMFLK